MKTKWIPPTEGKKVTRCRDCPYQGYTCTWVACCNAPPTYGRRRLPIFKRIPDWCPLQDYKEQDKLNLMKAYGSKLDYLKDHPETNPDSVANSCPDANCPCQEKLREYTKKWKEGHGINDVCKHESVMSGRCSDCGGQIE